MSVWPEIIAPPQYDDAPAEWEDPALPDFQLIWNVARECGYAVGLHGSMKRDCDLIAVPWTHSATSSGSLIVKLCGALDAKVVGEMARKPNGRRAWNIQVNGYVKVIDISVTPRLPNRSGRLQAVKCLLGFHEFELMPYRNWPVGKYICVHCNCHA